MKFGTIVKTTVVGTAALLATSCRGPLRKIANKADTSKAIEYLNISSKKVLNDTTYKLFGRDTIFLPQPLEEDLASFTKEINKAAKEKMPKTIIGSHKELKPNVRLFGINEEVTKFDYADNFTNTKVVVKDELFRDKKFSGSFYVPVEFYGQKAVIPPVKEFGK